MGIDASYEMYEDALAATIFCGDGSRHLIVYPRDDLLQLLAMLRFMVSSDDFSISSVEADLVFRCAMEIQGLTEESLCS